MYVLLTNYLPTVSGTNSFVGRVIAQDRGSQDVMVCSQKNKMVDDKKTRHLQYNTHFVMCLFIFYQVLKMVVTLARNGT